MDEPSSPSPPPFSDAPGEVAPRQFKCRSCGARMEFLPGAESQRCPYCGFVHEIPRSPEEIEELDYEARLRELASAAEAEEAPAGSTVKCGVCGAETRLDPSLASDHCPFCGSNVVLPGGSTRSIKPQSLLPFRVKREAAHEAFRSWLGSLWFAPSALTRHAEAESRLEGLYVPYWTYDCATTTAYRGERGEHYWVTVTTGSGANRRSRQVRKTRWYPASGVVFEDFDDVLVLASRSLPKACADRLEPWDLAELAPYRDEYLAGFRTEMAQVTLEEGFQEAKEHMERVIRAAVKGDIGGDEQRIHSLATRHERITFKHILLPVWLSAYRYRDWAYRFLVNARTGEVQGERPWSWVKISLAVLAGAAAAAGLVYFLHFHS